MPGFIDHAGDVGFTLGITDDKAVFPAVFFQPHQAVPAFQIHSQAGLVLAGAGSGHSCLGFFLGILIAVAHIHELHDLPVKGTPLVDEIPVGACDAHAQACGFQVAEHPFIVLRDLGVHIAVRTHLYNVQREFLRQRVIFIGQQQLIALGGKVILHLIDYLGAHGHHAVAVKIAAILPVFPPTGGSGAVLVKEVGISRFFHPAGGVNAFTETVQAFRQPGKTLYAPSLVIQIAPAVLQGLPAGKSCAGFIQEICAFLQFQPARGHGSVLMKVAAAPVSILPAGSHKTLFPKKIGFPLQGLPAGDGVTLFVQVTAVFSQFQPAGLKLSGMVEVKPFSFDVLPAGQCQALVIIIAGMSVFGYPAGLGAACQQKYCQQCHHTNSFHRVPPQAACASSSDATALSACKYSSRHKPVSFMSMEISTPT